MKKLLFASFCLFFAVILGGCADNEEYIDASTENTRDTRNAGQMIADGLDLRGYIPMPERVINSQVEEIHFPHGGVASMIPRKAGIFFYDERDFGNLFGNLELTPFYAPEDYYVFDFLFDPNQFEYSFTYTNFYRNIFLSYSREDFAQVSVMVNGENIAMGDYGGYPEFVITLLNGEATIVEVTTITHDNQEYTYTISIYTPFFEYNQSAARPVLKGTFIQPWDNGGPSHFTDDEWDEHLQMLQRAGINTIVLQWTARTDANGNVTSVFFGSAYARENGNPASAEQTEFMVERLLRSATKHNMQVFLGTVIEEDGWWAGAYNNTSWRETQNRIGNIMLQEIYDRYKSMFPDAFAGWYWAWEMYTVRDYSSFNPAWAEMFSANTLWLDEIDEYNMPMLISPFHSSYQGRTPRDAYEQWSNFFEIAHWRDGDIFCAQDSVGAGGGRASLPKADALNRATKTAVRNASTDIAFWINVENFTESEDGRPFTIEPALIERFIQQLEVAGRFTDYIITYSYSHFFNGNGSTAERRGDADYRAYLNMQ